MRQDVTDSLSNRPEQIVEAARIIGRSKHRRAVFEAIYHHKKQWKSVSEITEKTGLSRMKVLQNGGHLAKSHLVDQEKRAEGIGYKQIPFMQANKKEILRIAGNKTKISKVATKRAPAGLIPDAVTFEKPIRRKRPARKRSSPKKVTKLRIAFLSTNPDENSALRTDIEARNVLQILKSTPFRDQISVTHVPAARWIDLVDALNDFQPDVIHFSGHGRSSGLLFDNNDVSENGGIDLDFQRINNFLKTAKTRPKLLVLNACDTEVDADIFLESVGCIVAMSKSIDDAAASFFATRFYSALGSDLSILNAMEQGKACLAAAGYEDADLPILICSGDEGERKFFK